jgi:hypothetical protein
MGIFHKASQRSLLNGHHAHLWPLNTINCATRLIGAKAEWPLSENAKEKELPRDGEAFDFNAQPRKFYLEAKAQDGREGSFMKVRLLIATTLDVSHQRKPFNRALQGFKQTLAKPHPWP